MDKSLIIFTSSAVILTMLLGAQFFMEANSAPISEEGNVTDKLAVTELQTAIPAPAATEEQVETDQTPSQPEPNVNELNSNTTTASTNPVNVDPNTKIPILMYHAIGDGPNDLFLQTNLFEDQIAYLSRNKYNFITFEDLKNEYIPNKPIIITFDDGYKNLYENAYPILKKYDAKATIFLISNFIGSTSYLTTEQITEMNDLISFQSHTVTHPDLRFKSIESVDYEARISKAAIQGLVKNKVIAFCYPSGKFNENTIKATRKYYDYGITIMNGLYTINDDPYIINRIRISKGDNLYLFIKKLPRQ